MGYMFGVEEKVKIFVTYLHTSVLKRNCNSIKYFPNSFGLVRGQGYEYSPVWRVVNRKRRN